ncbi:lysozyme g isoform X2 [Coturnix japonica]|uniref:Lysozyme g n=2 Tax=Coturnix japonica TaxID=93934 RepID=A0A8C2SM62_COTJA|nr:lysozyme g isoform X2 [Coturnix japonica]XP_015706088.1 lysozyme g isoform X2 [Coturnix japonica]XP_032297589.1 lysozyme g isoform X2 [Coturnix japonica]
MLRKNDAMRLVLTLLGLTALLGVCHGRTDCYGSVSRINTPGASCKTAKPEGLNYCGVQASKKIAERDLGSMNRYKALIKRAGEALCIEPALIAGIISRESHAGKVLKNGWGDNGNGFGLMQVDKRYHKIEGTWNGETHIRQGTRILIDMIKKIQRKFPRWTRDQQLKGGISAYNAGTGNVRSYDRMDIGTTHDDYSNDVVARAQYFKQNGY